jgi:hypothetical protein
MNFDAFVTAARRVENHGFVGGIEEFLKSVQDALCYTATSRGSHRARPFQTILLYNVRAADAACP